MTVETREKDEREDEDGKKYFVEIDGVEFAWAQNTITPAQMRKLASIPDGTPMIQVDENENETQLVEDVAITLKPGHRYGKRVRWKRG